MKIILTYDHGGYDLGQQLVDWLQKTHTVINMGAPSFDANDDFPPLVHRAIKQMQTEKNPIGIFVCGSGTGVCMTANRTRGIRAALCHSVEYATLARQHNDANVLCLGGRFVTLARAKKIVSAFLETPFLGGKYATRNKLIDN